MTILALQGLRGGTGASATAAAIGHALHMLGKTVLLIDLCPENMLGLHFNLPACDADGWARAVQEGMDWQVPAWEIEPGLQVLPHGLATAGRSAHDASQVLQWDARLALLATRYDWIVLDVPAHAQTPACHLKLQVIEADAACHALLCRLHRPDAASSYYLINRYEPLSQLQRDLRLLWQQSLARRLVPQVIHRDEFMAEALACKMPVTRYNADSLASKDVGSVATWCLARAGKQE